MATWMLAPLPAIPPSREARKAREAQQRDLEVRLCERKQRKDRKPKISDFARRKRRKTERSSCEPRPQWAQKFGAVLVLKVSFVHAKDSRGRKQRRESSRP